MPFVGIIGVNDPEGVALGVDAVPAVFVVVRTEAPDARPPDRRSPHRVTSEIGLATRGRGPVMHGKGCPFGPGAAILQAKKE